MKSHAVSTVEVCARFRAVANYVGSGRPKGSAAMRRPFVMYATV